MLRLHSDEPKGLDLYRNILLLSAFGRSGNWVRAGDQEPAGLFLSRLLDQLQ